MPTTVRVWRGGAGAAGPPGATSGDPGLGRVMTIVPVTVVGRGTIGPGTNGGAAIAPGAVWGTAMPPGAVGGPDWGGPPCSGACGRTSAKPQTEQAAAFGCVGDPHCVQCTMERNVAVSSRPVSLAAIGAACGLADTRRGRGAGLS